MLGVLLLFWNVFLHLWQLLLLPPSIFLPSALEQGLFAVDKLVDDVFVLLLAHVYSWVCLLPCVAVACWLLVLKLLLLLLTYIVGYIRTV